MPLRHATEADVPDIIRRHPPSPGRAWIVAESDDPERDRTALDRAGIRTTIVHGVVLLDHDGLAIGGIPPHRTPVREVFTAEHRLRVVGDPDDPALVRYPDHELRAPGLTGATLRRHDLYARAYELVRPPIDAWELTLGITTATDELWDAAGQLAGDLPMVAVTFPAVDLTDRGFTVAAEQPERKGRPALRSWVRRPG